MSGPSLTSKRAQRGGRKSKILIPLAILVLASLAVVSAGGTVWKGGLIEGLLSYFEVRPEEHIPTISVMRQDYTVRTGVDGVLVGLYAVPVVAPRLRRGPMRIAWLAPEGSVVARGQTLVRFDETEALLSLEQGENLLAAQSQRIENSTLQRVGGLEQLKMEQQAADLEKSYAASQVRKDETIFSRWEIRESLLSADLAASKLVFLSNREGLQEELGASELRELNVEKTSAEAAVEMAQEALSSLSVRSPAPGVIVYKKIQFTPPEVGSTVWPEQTVMEISSADRFRAIVSIPEVDIGTIQKGNRVDVVLNAFPDNTITGQIESLSRVARQFNRKDPRKYFECSVLIDVESGLSLELKPGMDLEASIIVEDLTDALVLPRSSVFADGSRTFVFVTADGSIHREQDVTIVASDHGFHVVDGLDEGVEVYLRHPLREDEIALPDFSTPAGSTRDSEFVLIE